MTGRQKRMWLSRFLVPGLILFLVLPIDSLARTKGAQVEVSSAGKAVSGELLALGEDFLLLATPENPVGQKFHFPGIDMVRVLRSNSGKGARTGFFIGVAAGFLIVANTDVTAQTIFELEKDEGIKFRDYLLGVAGVAALGALVGSLIGSGSKSYKEFHFKGASAKKLKALRKKLRYYARHWK